MINECYIELKESKMCDFTINTIIGVIALFNMAGFPECSPGHPNYGYSDDQQEIVCWGYLKDDLIEATNPMNTTSVIGRLVFPDQSSCDSHVLLPAAPSYYDPAPEELSPDYLPELG